MSESDSEKPLHISYAVEYSKSNRAKCRICNEKIEKGVVRIVKNVCDPSIHEAYGHDDNTAYFQHLNCTKKPLPSECKSFQNLGGYKGLAPSDQLLIKAWWGDTDAAAAAVPAAGSGLKAERGLLVAAEAEAAHAEISADDQHEFLNLAKDYEWDQVKSQVEARPHIINVQPLGRNDGMVRWSALHQASYCGDADMVRWLLDAKASVEAKEKEGKTPLEVVKGSTPSAAAIKAMLKGSTKRKAAEEPKAKVEPEPKAKAEPEPTAEPEPKKAEPEPKAKAKSKANITTKPQPGSLSGKRVVFSGTMEWSRPFAVMKAEEAGATVLLQVASTMDVLIAGPDSKNKAVKAGSFGKEIWDEDLFKAALGK